MARCLRDDLTARGACATLRGAGCCLLWYALQQDGRDAWCPYLLSQRAGEGAAREDCVGWLTTSMNLHLLSASSCIYSVLRVTNAYLCVTVPLYGGWRWYAPGRCWPSLAYPISLSSSLFTALFSSAGACPLYLLRRSALCAGNALLVPFIACIQRVPFPRANYLRLLLPVSSRAFCYSLLRTPVLFACHLLYTTCTQPLHATITYLHRTTTISCQPLLPPPYLPRVCISAV